MTLQFLLQSPPVPQASMMTFRHEAASTVRNSSATHSSWLAGTFCSQQRRRVGELAPKLRLDAYNSASGDLDGADEFLLQPRHKL